MVSQWLDAVIRSTKAEAELKVLEKREKDYEEQYKVFSPVGTQIHRKEREIKFTILSRGIAWLKPSQAKAKGFRVDFQ